MDIASLIGLIIGTLCLGIVFFEVSHGHLMMFYSLEGVLMVGGGSISVVFMAMPMKQVKCAFAYTKKFLFHKGNDFTQQGQLVTRLAEVARKDGILALESHMDEVKAFDPFLATGIRMAVDGQDVGVIETLMRLEIMAMKERHKAGKKMFDLVKLYGPGWALVGTLIGQVGMFGNLEGAEIGKLGHMLAIAVCATMYGTVVSNAIAGPIGDKLAFRSSQEMLSRELSLQAVLSIAGGDNPRTTTDKVAVFLPNAQRELLLKAA